MAEAYLRERAASSLKVYSAGSLTDPHVNPRALSVLENHEVPTAGLRSKNWTEVANADGVAFDYVITVCDRAHDFLCGLPQGLSGSPIILHWGTIDPADPANAEIEDVYDLAFAHLKTRIDRFLAVDHDAPRDRREAMVRAIGSD